MYLYRTFHFCLPVPWGDTGGMCWCHFFFFIDCIVPNACNPNMGYVKLSWIEPTKVGQQVDNAPFAINQPSMDELDANGLDTGNRSTCITKLSELIEFIEKLVRKGCININAVSISEKEYSRWYRSMFL